MFAQKNSIISRSSRQLELFFKDPSNPMYFLTPGFSEDLKKLKEISTSKNQLNFIEIIEANIKEITSSFSQKLSTRYINFTASELQVSDLIRKDFTNKEIAKQLNIAEETVSSHRKHIRKKLGLTNKKTNLTSFLKSLQ